MIQNEEPRRPTAVRLNEAERHALRMLAARRRLSGGEVLRRLIHREARRVGLQTHDRLQAGEFRHIGDILRDTLKEVDRRAELRQRLEAEHGRPISDEEFLKIAKRSGGLDL